MRSIWLDFAQVLFLCVMDRDMVELYKHANNEQGQYQAILMGNTGFVIWKKNIFFWNTAGVPQRTR